MATWRGRQRTNLLVFVCVALFLFIFHRDVLFPTGKPDLPVSDLRLGEDDVEMVVASMTSENVTWLDNYLLDWKKNIYVVNDRKASHTVPVNKGREAMVFLTFVLLHSRGPPHSLIRILVLTSPDYLGISSRDTTPSPATSSSIMPSASNGTTTTQTTIPSPFSNASASTTSANKAT